MNNLKKEDYKKVKSFNEMLKLEYGLVGTHNRDEFEKNTKIFIQSEKDKLDWWDDLTPQQQEQLSKSIEDSHNPENWIDYDDFKKKNERWFKN